MVGPPNNEKKNKFLAPPLIMSALQDTIEMYLYIRLFFSLSFSFVFDASCQHLKI